MPDEYAEVDWQLLSEIEAELENMGDAEFAYDPETDELVAEVVSADDDPEFYAAVVNGRQVAAEESRGRWRVFGILAGLGLLGVTVALIVKVAGD